MKKHCRHRRSCGRYLDHICDGSIIYDGGRCCRLFYKVRTLSDEPEVLGDISPCIHRDKCTFDRSGNCHDADRCDRYEDDHTLADASEKLADLLIEKQKAYGDSFGKSGGVLEILYPDGVRVDQYTDLLTVTRVIDKLFRIAHKKDAFDENPWQDIAGYALLSVVHNKPLAKNNEKE